MVPTISSAASPQPIQFSTFLQALSLNLHSLFSNIGMFFQWVGQTITWSWNVLVKTGAIATSVRIETFFGGISLVSPRLANLGRSGVLHVRNWWTALKAAHEKTLLQQEVESLRKENENLKQRIREKEETSTQNKKEQRSEWVNQKAEIDALTDQLRRTEKALQESRNECGQAKLDFENLQMEMENQQTELNLLRSSHEREGSKRDYSPDAKAFLNRAQNLLRLHRHSMDLTSQGSSIESGWTP